MHKSTSGRRLFDQKLKIFTPGVERLDRVTGPPGGKVEKKAGKGS